MSELSRPLRTLVCVNVRDQVKLALGKRPHPALPELTYINVATTPVVIRPLDAGLKSRFRANFPCWTPRRPVITTATTATTGGPDEG